MWKGQIGGLHSPPPRFISVRRRVKSGRLPLPRHDSNREGTRRLRVEQELERRQTERKEVRERESKQWLLFVSEFSGGCVVSGSRISPRPAELLPITLGIALQIQERYTVPQPQNSDTNFTEPGTAPGYEACASTWQARWPGRGSYGTLHDPLTPTTLRTATSGRTDDADNQTPQQRALRGGDNKSTGTRRFGDWRVAVVVLSSSSLSRCRACGVDYDSSGLR